jgi:hypothetical protein
MSEITPQPLAQMPGPWVDHQHGRLCESSDVVAFFGRKTSNPNELARSFPQLTFSFQRIRKSCSAPMGSAPAGVVN